MAAFVAMRFNALPLRAQSIGDPAVTAQMGRLGHFMQYTYYTWSLMMLDRNTSRAFPILVYLLSTSGSVIGPCAVAATPDERMPT